MEGDWTTRAACRGADLNLFFGDTIREADRARAFCAQCPVTTECREMAEALDGSEAYGVFGGLTGRERTRQRATARQRAAA